MALFPLYLLSSNSLLKAYGLRRKILEHNNQRLKTGGGPPGPPLELFPVLIIE